MEEVVAAAQAAGISSDVMKQQISRAYKQRMAAQKKAQEKKQLDVYATHQPHNRQIRYDNMRSAIAEETVLKMLLRENALFETAKELKPQHFSVPMFAKAYETLRRHWTEDHNAGVAMLSEVLTQEEMAHMTAIIHKDDPPISQEAFADCLRVIMSEARKASGEGDLRSLQEVMRKKKGYGGT